MSEDYTGLLQTNLSCTHHWIISEAAGPQSDGVCKNCGKIKAFKNSIFAETNHITLEGSHDDHREWRKFSF